MIEASARKVQARIVTGIAIVHAVLVFSRLDGHGLWLDEVMSIEAATGSWHEMRRFFRSLPEQHPLYYLLLRPWLGLWGDSAHALRGLSALTSLGTVPLLFLLLRRIFGSTSALLGTALYAVAPFSVFYGQEGRMYSLVLLLVSLSSWVWLRVLDDPGSVRLKVLYVICATAGVYTHFFFAFVVLAHGLVGFSWPQEAGLVRRVRMMVPTVIVGALYLPWVAVIFANFPEGQDWKGPIHAALGAPYTLLRFALGYSFIQPDQGWQDRVPDLVRADGWAVVAAMLGFGILAVTGLNHLRKRSAAADRRAALVFGVVPVAVPLALSPFMVLSGERYFLVVYPIFLGVVATGIHSCLGSRSRWGRAMGTWALLLVFVVWSVGHVRYADSTNFGKEGWREVAGFIVESKRPGEFVFHFPGYVGPPLSYYLERHEVSASPVPIGSCEDLPVEAGWIIVSYRDDPSGILSCLRSTGRIQAETMFPQGAGIRLIRLRSSGSELLDDGLRREAERAEWEESGTSATGSGLGG